MGPFPAACALVTDFSTRQKKDRPKATSSKRSKILLTMVQGESGQGRRRNRKRAKGRGGGQHEAPPVNGLDRSGSESSSSDLGPVEVGCSSSGIVSNIQKNNNWLKSLKMDLCSYDLAKLREAERKYYSQLAFTMKTQEAEAEDDVDLFASDEEEEEEPKAAPVKLAPKPAVKPAPQPAPVKKEPVPQKAAPEKIWTNKAECDDAEKKFQESMAQTQTGILDLVCPLTRVSGECRHINKQTNKQPGSYRNPVNAERTFIMLKPDAVHRGLVGVIVKRFESRGFKLLACKFMKANEELLKQHYIDLSKKGFFAELIRYMSSGPVVPMVWEGLNAVKQGRVMLGATNPKDSAPGTIRGDFCIDVGRNIIHGSDSVESANKEISLWFTKEEIASWRSATVEWVYEDEELELAPVPVKVDGLVALAGGDDMNLTNKLNALEVENKQLKKVTEDLKSLVSRLEARVAKLEVSGGSPAKPSAAPAPAPAPAKEEEEDDDDVDLFGSDEDEEEDAEKARITAERLKAYHERKAKKPALIAKTNVLFDVKPWDDETDMDEMLKACKSIEKEGLVWGASKLVPVGYGINKLQIMCVVEDEKVSIDELSEKMAEFEDFVQSVDVAAMSKI